MNVQPTIARIQKVTARHFGVSIAELKSPRRSRMIARPRQLAMTLARDHTRHSLPEIGRRFGGRDHTTVLHAIRKIAELTETDALIKADYEVLQAEILECVETTGSLESLAKLLAPVIADEINLNFVLQIEQAKAKACKKKKVVMVTNELESELLQAITCATQNFAAYENACGTFGEKLRLERFIESFSHLRAVHREFESTQTPRKVKP